MFDLSGYKPQKMTDGFEPFKGTFTCSVNYARIEDYKGEKEELKGNQFFRYELEVLNDENFTGRRLWGSFNLDNEKSLKKLADTLFTLGLEFKNDDELTVAGARLAGMMLTVKAWHFKGDKGDLIQQHMIKGEANEGSTTSEAAPF